MNIDEFKIAWKDYDQKLQSTRMLSDKIIISMIRERSNSRLAKVITHQFFGLVYVGGLLFLGIAILAGNPFDYQQVIEFVPVGIYCLCMLLLILGMLRSYFRLRQIDLNKSDVDSSLRTIIRIYETPGKYLFIAIRLLFVTASVLFPLSFLPRKIEAAGWARGLLETLIPLVVTAVLLFIAHKLGAFKERNSEKFKRDREELAGLKKLSAELREAGGLRPEV